MFGRNSTHRSQAASGEGTRMGTLIRYAKNELIRVTRSSPALYRIHLRYFRDGRNVRFPRRGDLIHLTGYPRSANTYAMHLLRAAARNGEGRVSTHIHAPASIRVALRARVPTLVLIRDPLDAVASAMVKRRASAAQTATADEFLYYYWSYYSFVKARRNRLALVDYLTVTRQPVELLRSVQRASPEIDLEPNLHAVVDEVQALMEARNRIRPVEDRSIPDPEKERRKLDLRERIRARPWFERVLQLYLDLSPLRGGT